MFREQVFPFQSLLAQGPSADVGTFILQVPSTDNSFSDLNNPMPSTELGGLQVIDLFFSVSMESPGVELDLSHDFDLAVESPVESDVVSPQMILHLIRVLFPQSL